MHDRLLELLRAVQRGEMTPEEAEASLSPETDLGFAVVDDDRERRTGLPEVAFGEGKTPEQLARILRHVGDRGQKALATRVSAEKAELVRLILPDVVYEPLPRLLWRAPTSQDPWAPTLTGSVCVIAAGTSDVPVAEEAARCAEWFGLRVNRVTDVGVAGLHRLLKRVDAIREADVVIAVAGMEGALPSVVAGLVRTPVIAVPTSIGYGTNFGGIAPMLAMLNACAAGVAVVNIDNGFGAAQVAWRMVAARASS
jgi:NCAIR mutase (PurE)-related protein